MLLDHILKPRAVAVVGASTRPHTIGNDLLKRLLEYGFKGHIYPVNPKGGEIEGLRAYTSVNELPDGVDLAVIVVNAKFVLSTVDECAARGIKGLVVISAGFKERPPARRSARGQGPRQRNAHGRSKLPRRRQHQPECAS
jgi:acyl-CoA synthetase (NDP forming)